MSANPLSQHTGRRAAVALMLGLGALAAVALTLGVPRSQAAPMMQGTGGPEFLAITVTSDLPVSDTHPYQGITKTVYFSNNVEGVLTLTLEITGTAPLTLATGAAFDEGERVYTSDVAPRVLEVTSTIRTTHETQAAIPYTVTDGIPLTATVAITFVRDITAPAVTIENPADPIWISVTLNITGTAADEGSGVRQVKVATDTLWVSASGTESWEYSWDPPTGQNGTAYTISVRAEDYLGIESPVATRVITVDNVMTGTVSNLTSPSHITDVWSNQSTITVTWGAADDGPGIGLGGHAVLWDTSPSTDPTDVNLDATSTSTSTTLADGDNHYFHIRAVDGLGNRGPTLHLGPFKVDTVSPAVTITTPSAGTWLTTTHQPDLAITGTATDGHSGVAWVDVTTGTTWVSATGTTSWQYAWTLPTSDNVVYTLTARARDPAGNWGFSADVPVTVDTVAPTAAAPSPHRSPWVTSTVVYTWPASTDGSGIAGYRVNITNTAGYTATLWAPDAVLTFTAALTEGAGYFARVRAVDGAGNEGDWSGPSSVVTPDLTAPTVAVTAPARIATTTFQVSWSATDNGSGVDFYRVEYQQDGGTWQTWLPITTTTGATFTAAELEHIYTFRVTAYDRVGNAGEGQATTRVALWRVYIPLVVRNYPPSWSRGSGTAGIQFRTPSGCGTSTWYAGTWDRGIWKSSDNSQQWTQVFQWTDNPYPVVANPSNCNQAFASRWGQGVWRIEGSTASPINTGLGEMYVYGLAITGTTLYAGTYSKGVYKTDINTVNWQPANNGIGDLRIRSVTAIGNEIYAGARGCKLYVSGNAGASWSEETVLSGGCDDAQVWSVAKAGNTLYAGLGLMKGLYFKAGSSWQKVSAVPNRTIYGLAYDSANGILYVSAYGAGVYRCSLDAQGQVVNCTPHNIGLSTLNTREIAVHSGRVVVGSDDGIWYIPAFR